jgi:hypothetical protein
MPLRLLYLGFVLACMVHAQTILPHSQDADSKGEQANPAAAQGPALVSCPAGAPLGAMDVRVLIPVQKPLPFRTITHLTEGDTLQYSPILRPKEKRPGEIALILVPAKREIGTPEIFVTDPKPAGKPEQWKMDRTISLAALVYGPSGLNRKKVTKFLAKDEVLIAQLADYAAKTEQTEKLVETLSNKESSPSSISAALSSFQSGFGLSAETNENPVAGANPLASSTVLTSASSGGVAGMAASFFFADPVGVATGGMSALLELRAIAFPDTQFRASFAKTIKDSQLSLCGQQGDTPAHTRIAYIWASRIPNADAPVIHIGDADFIPAHQKTPVPVKVAGPAWKYLDRARDWALVDSHNKKTPISVVKLGKQKALEIDLTKAHPAPGDYKLTAFWDWAPMEAIGSVHVRALGDFKQAHLETASQDRLMAASGKNAVTLTGGDFEFITKVEMKKLNDEFATAASVPFHLPKGLRKGPQDHVDVQIDTENLTPAAYELLISQPGSKSHPVNFKILPSPPHIDNLPIIVNQGAGTQHFVLKGQRLDLLAKLEAPGAAFKLGADSGDGERSVTVEMNSAPRPGAELAVKEFLDDRTEPLTLSNALEVTGPLPLIASSKLSLPAGMAIAVRGNEFPAGYTLNALLDVKNIERASVLRLGCSDDAGEHAALALGEQTAHWNLEQLSPDQLFLAFDTSALPAGCTLEAVIDNGRSGKSQPFPLARIAPVPQVESFSVSTEAPINGMRRYRLTGTNLELIEKLGWEAANAVTVSELPAPLPGPGLKQSIDVNLPDPAVPDANLYVWLRGDKQARATTFKAPALSTPAPSPAAPAAAPTAQPR